MKTSDNGKKFIKNEEGCKLVAYQDATGTWTISYGSIFHLDGTKVKKGDKITLQQAVELFDKLLPQYEEAVNKLTNISQNNFDALTSFTWNEGEGGLLNSSLFKKVQENPNDKRLVEVVKIPDLYNYVKIQLQKEKREWVNTIEYSFLLYSKSKGVFLIDLYQRRGREYNLYKS